MSIFNNLIPSLARNEPAANGDLSHSVKPAYEIKETPEAFGVTVHLPGVTKDGLDITAEEGRIQIVGRRAWKQPEGWTTLHRETVDVPYALVLTHDNAVDAEKIVAELRDGVLRVSLPKHEALKPRKIAVN
jgi:HSP20 family protein